MKKQCSGRVQTLFLAIILALSYFPSMARANGIMDLGVVEWNIKTGFPSGRILQPGMTRSVRHTVHHSPLFEILGPQRYIKIDSIDLKIYRVEDGEGRVELAHDVADPSSSPLYHGAEISTSIEIPSDAAPGRCTFETTADATVWEYDKKKKAWKSVGKISLKDIGEVWVKGTLEVRGSRAPLDFEGMYSGYAKLPFAVYPGEQPTGEVYVRNLLGTPKVWTLRIEKVVIRFGHYPKGELIGETQGPEGPPVKSQTLQVTGPVIPLDAPTGLWGITTTIYVRSFPTGDATSEEEEIVWPFRIWSSLHVVERTPDECVIATAAFGSPMSPQVARMRRFRNERVMTTFTGRNFMGVFNTWYYSWGRHVADGIRDDDQMRAVTRVALYPVMGAMKAAEGTYFVLSFHGELAAAVSILSAAFVCGALYIAPVVLVLNLILRRLGLASIPGIVKHVDWLLILVFMASTLTLFGGLIHSVGVNTFGMTLLAVVVTYAAASLVVEVLVPRLRDLLVSPFRAASF